MTDQVGAAERPDGVVLEPAAQAFLDAVQQQSGSVMTLEAVQSRPIEKLPVDEAWAVVPAEVGEVGVWIVRPPAVTQALPAILYLHGGGYSVGSAATHDRLVRELAVGAHAAVVFVDYDRGPGSQFPVALEQGYAAGRWIGSDGAAYGIDPSRIAVAGDSVGGTMAAVLALMAKDRGDLSFVQQSLYYPVTDASLATSARHDQAGDHLLTAAGLAAYWAGYLPDTVDRTQVYASPLHARPEQLTGLPPAFVVVAEADIAREEGAGYAARLRAAGVPVTAVRYDGVPHDFMMLNPLSHTNATRAAVQQAAALLRSALHGGGAHQPHGLVAARARPMR